jgi:hypothetical protein
MKFEIIRQFLVKFSNAKVKKILPAALELFHANGRTDCANCLPACLPA